MAAPAPVAERPGTSTMTTKATNASDMYLSKMYLDLAGPLFVVVVNMWGLAKFKHFVFLRLAKKSLLKMEKRFWARILFSGCPVTLIIAHRSWRRLQLALTVNGQTPLYNVFITITFYSRRMS